MTNQPLDLHRATDGIGQFELQVETLSIATLVAAERLQPDVILMDASESFQDFIQLFRSAQALELLANIPIVAWFDRAGHENIALAIDAGADDCLTLDLENRESLARLRAVTRRSTRRTRRSEIRFADLTLDTASLKVWHKGRIVPLTQYQFRLLKFLMMHPGEIFSRRQLLDQVWGRHSIDEGSVTACVARIRRALGHADATGLIRSMRGAGYSLDGDAGDAPPYAAGRDHAAVLKS